MTPRRTTAAVLAVLALLLLGSGCGTATAGSGSGSSGQDSGLDAVPAAADVLDFEGETLDGEAFEGPSLAGSPTVLWFWAPWCPTCVAQVDGVNALAERFDDVQVVGVGGLDEPAALAGFAEDVDAGVTVLADPEGEVWRHFGVTAQSTYVVLDADGEAVEAGYLEDAELVDVVASLDTPTAG